MGVFLYVGYPPHHHNSYTTTHIHKWYTTTIYTVLARLTEFLGLVIRHYPFHFIIN